MIVIHTPTCNSVSRIEFPSRIQTINNVAISIAKKFPAWAVLS